MLKYILKRLLMFIPVVLGVLFVTFTINYFSPGDAAIATLGSEASQEALESFREENGLNDPFPVQFYNYAKGVITRFDFGSSYYTAEGSLCSLRCLARLSAPSSAASLAQQQVTLAMLMITLPCV